ncbi:MAG: TrpR-related protein YerC/YecD [Clostridia bacterium]|nr:TrpR-related protein YerC/YecD [Clostridia bacterium]
MIDKKVMQDYLYGVLAKTTDPQVIALLLEDLCTYAETENMAQRLYSAKLILEGNTYVQVENETLISSATLSRVSRCIKYGKGGYRTVIEK